MTKYLLVSEPTGLSAKQLGERVGMRAYDTPLGTMLEQPEPFDMQGALAEIERAMNPNACTCGNYAIIHRPNCPAWNVMT